MASLRDRIKYALNGVKNFENNLGNLVTQNQQTLLELNRSQILQGRNTDGELFSPTYQADPYFKSPESAQRYANMKESLISNHNALILYPLFTQKPADVPNLIISGAFLMNMFISTSKDSYVISSSYNRSDAIVNKYSGKVFGLSSTTIAFFREKFLIPELRKTIYL